MKKLLVLDNYDSFTYNLVHMLDDAHGYQIEIKKNDEISAEAALNYDKIILSPGPGIPSEAGNLMDILNATYKSKTILGVCLGHQAITELFGGTLINLPQVYHGIEATIIKTNIACPILKSLDHTFLAGRYHSWASDKPTFPGDLLITSEDKDKEIMSFRHKQLPIYGVQFHPESIMTPKGQSIIDNFLAI